MSPPRIASALLRVGQALFLAGFGLLLGVHVVSARPPLEPPGRPHMVTLDASPRLPATPGLFSVAANDTFYFGGTVWAADSLRWEALSGGVWTFDSGVGSHFDHAAPGVDPFKDPSLHASMEGWVGLDRTYLENPYFRRMNANQFGTGQNDCSLNGDWFFWAGVLPSEAALLCYAGGQGYGNNWNVCIEHEFDYTPGAISFSYEYANDTELEFDYTYVLVDTGGTAEVTIASHTDRISGINFLNLTPGVNLPTTAGPIKFRFCVVSDGAYSDEDGDYTTSCGAFALDDVSISGGGINYFTDFETSDGGWVLSDPPQGPGGEWSDIVDLADLPPPLTQCSCDLGDSVLVFQDLTTLGHGLFQDNIALSPWVDLKAAGLVGSPGKFVETSVYAYLPSLNYVYAQVMVQWYPYICPASGKIITSPLTNTGQNHYFGLSPECTSPGEEPIRFDFSSIIDAGAEQVRIGLGVFSTCLFFPNCTGLTNTSPWFDNVKLGVWEAAGGGGTPLLSAQEWDLPQDAFPTDGTLNLGSAARVDAGVVKGAPEPAPGTALGDTLVVSGGSGGAEVFVQFAVHPGPGTDPGDLAAFLSRATFQESKDGLDWYAARMDTAEQGGVLSPGSWMTTFHEDDPGFVGSDTDTDPNDLDPLGGMTHLANDVFPDDLFTPGSRINLFFKTRFTASSAWYTLPDTGSGTYEIEVLPSSMDTTKTFNCVLYVDHAEEEAQAKIEGGLAQALPSPSTNFEQTAWDRYDVRAPSSHQAPLGRPVGTQYGGTLQQLSGYRTLVWNSGSLSAYNLVQEDADVLIPWLTGSESHGAYLSGDDLASSMTLEGGSDPGSQALLEDIAGVLLTCGSYREADCPTGSPLDATVCVDIEPAGGPVSVRPLGGSHQAEGNGCPFNHSFDVVSANPSPLSGDPAGDERYATGVKFANFASVASADTVANYRTVFDGVSLHHRRNEGSCGLMGAAAPPAVEERLREVFSWLGTPGGAGTCSDPSNQTGVEDGDPLPIPTALLGMSPNPLRGGISGRITFSLARAGHARLDVFDLQGRLVKTVADGDYPAGNQDLAWDGRDEGGRPVGSGVYFLRLDAGGEILTRKGVVIQTRR